MKGSDVLNKLRADKSALSSRHQEASTRLGQQRARLEQATQKTNKALQDFVLYRVQLGATGSQVGQEIARRNSELSDAIADAQQQVAKLQEEHASALRQRSMSDDAFQASTAAWEAHCREARVHWAVTSDAQACERAASDVDYRLEFYLSEQKRWSGVVSDVEERLSSMPWFKNLATSQPSSWWYQKMRQLAGQDHNEQVLSNVKARAAQIEKVVDGLVSEKNTIQNNLQLSLIGFEKNHLNGQVLFDAYQTDRAAFERAQSQYARVAKEYQAASKQLEALLSDQNHFANGVSKSTVDAVLDMVNHSMDLVEADVRNTSSPKDDELLARWKQAAVAQQEVIDVVHRAENEWTDLFTQMENVQRVIDLFAQRGWNSSNYTFSSLTWPSLWLANSYHAFETSARYTPPPVSSPSYSSTRSSSGGWGSFGGGMSSTGGGFGGGGHRTGGGF